MDSLVKVVPTAVTVITPMAVTHFMDIAGARLAGQVSFFLGSLLYNVTELEAGSPACRVCASAL